MRYTALILAMIVGPVFQAVSHTARAGVSAAETRGVRAQKPALAIPPSLEHEHREIHELLTEATRAPGRVGAAARQLAAVLGPHFARENEIALPPLGLLAPLAAGQTPAGLQDALALTDALRKELPRMLEEHTRIREATETLRIAAREQKMSVHERFAETLAAHARTEEEILYPAAILVGDVIRARLARK